MSVYDRGMCAHPGCGSALPSFQLINGPLNHPPESGWKITTLPQEAAHLASAWTGHPGQPTSAKAAWWDMLDFLSSNGVRSPDISREVHDLGIEQWCSSDPKRCPREYRGRFRKHTPPDLPWAKDAWEAANNALANNLQPEDVKGTLDAVVTTLTALISSPTGCQRCHSHWLTHLETHPVPVNPTLDEARHWLVDIHNLTREGKTPTPFEEVKEKFSWL